MRRQSQRRLRLTRQSNCETSIARSATKLFLVDSSGAASRFVLDIEYSFRLRAANSHPSQNCSSHCSQRRFLLRGLTRANKNHNQVPDTCFATGIHLKRTSSRSWKSTASYWSNTQSFVRYEETKSTTFQAYRVGSMPSNTSALGHHWRNYSI